MQSDLVADVPRFSLAERDRRWAHVRALMRQEKLDVILVPPNTGLWDQFGANVRYLTGIGGGCAQVGAVFPLDGAVTAVTNPDVDVRYWRARQDWVDDIRPVTTWGASADCIARLHELGVDKGRIGITGLAGNTRYPEGVTSHGFVEQIRQAFPEAALVNANLLMERARFVRSEEEIGFIRKGVEVIEQALEVLRREARPGVPENVVYARMMASTVEQGGELPTMMLWAAGWPQPPSNQYMPSRRPLCAGDMISTEAEARWGGYIAQNTRQMFVGPVPDEYRRMFDRQQEALHACYDRIRPGNTMGDILAVANSFTDDDYECRLLMHARGLGDDSPIVIYSTTDELMRGWVLEAGATFIVKPEIRTRENARHVSRHVYWGDMIVVTDDGAQRLGTSTPEIMSIS